MVKMNKTTTLFPNVFPGKEGHGEAGIAETIKGGIRGQTEAASRGSLIVCDKHSS